VSGYTRFLEVFGPAEGLEGVIGVEIDGFARVHASWIKLLLTEAGYLYTEVPA